MLIKGENMRRFEMVSIDKLVPYEKNARTHTEQQVQQIADSIKEFGFVNPVLIDGNFGIIAGHGRVLGAKLLGMTEVPAVFVEDLSEAKKRAYILADNKLAEKAGWDIELVSLELEELENLGFDISLTGFDKIEQTDIDIDSFFEQSGEPKNKEPKKIQCPHCGEWFEI